MSLAHANSTHQLRMQLYILNKIDFAKKYNVELADLPQVLSEKAWELAVEQTNKQATNTNKGFRKHEVIDLAQYASTSSKIIIVS